MVHETKSSKSSTDTARAQTPPTPPQEPQQVRVIIKEAPPQHQEPQQFKIVMAGERPPSPPPLAVTGNTIWKYTQGQTEAQPKQTASSDFTRPFYTIPQLAKLLQVHENTIYRLVRAGKIEHYKIGAQIRISAAELERLKVERKA